MKDSRLPFLNPVRIHIRWALVGSFLLFGSLAWLVFMPMRQAVGGSLAFNIGGLVFILLLGGGLGVWLSQSILQPLRRMNDVLKQVLDGNITTRIQSSPRPYRNELTDLAAQVNAVLAQNQLQYDYLEKSVASKSRDLQVAADLSKQVTTTLALDSLLPEIVSLTRKGFDLAAVSIYLYDSAKHHLNLVASDVAPEYEPAYSNDWLENSATESIRTVAQNRMPLWQTKEMYNDEMLASPMLPEAQAEILIPLIVGETCLGVFHLQAEAKDRFDINDVATMFSFGGQIAIAIQNARSYEEQVRIAVVRQQANEMKSQFLASMSHELRTPLNAILNYTQFVSSGTLGETTQEQKDALGKSIKSAKHLLSLINDILDISKIAAGRLELFIQDVSLNEEVITAIEATEALLEGKPVELVVDLKEDIAIIHGDRRRLRQIFLNLISNAMKFTQEGLITVKTTDTHKGATFSVKDTGNGISPEDMKDIFEPFKQDESGLLHGHGTGLGLPISRRLAQAHGGQLSVESTPDEGSTFSVFIPYRTPVAEEVALELEQETA